VDSFFDILTGAPIGDGKATATYRYAPNGACVSVSDDNGHTTQFTYDTAGRRSSLIDPKGSVVQYTYDACNNLLSKTSNERSDLGQGSQQFSITYTYDALNRCVSTVDNVGNTNRYSYDSRHNVISHLDPRENESLSVFDGLNRCVTSINYVGKDRGITINTSHVEYNVNSRCTASTDSNGNTTSYAYDELNRCVAVTEADGTICSLVWSPRSNLLRVEDANGTTITNTFDLLNRIVHRDIAARGEALPTTTFEMFAYDGVSRCVAANNDVSLVTFGYDSLGHCVRASQDGLTSTATFDGADNRVALTYPSGRIVTFSYDGLNQITNLSSSAAGGLPFVTLATFGYEGPGRLGRTIRLNNVATRYQWNGLVTPKNAPEDFGWQQISGINHQVVVGGTVVDRRVSAFDRNQNRVVRTQTAPFYPGGPTRTNEFVYDAMNRLGGNIDSVLNLIRIYELDGNGNRLSVSSNGVSQLYTMDNTFPDPADFQMNQYTVTPFGPQAYDANGNLTSRLTPEGPIFFQYDYANRLVLVGALSAEGTLQPVATFAYDALGRRISKTTYPAVPLAPVTTQYVHGSGDCDDTAEILEVRSGGVLLATHASGAAAASYAATGRAAPPLVTFNTAGEPMFLHADDLGNVLALTDAAGSVLERYDYDEFGQPTFLTSDGQPLPSNESAFGNVFLFHGMEWDAETGLYYNQEGEGTRHNNPLFESSGNSGENPLFEGHYVDCQTATTIGLPKITPKIAKESHGKRFAGNNAWSPRASKGTVKFFNESKGFRGGGGGAGGIVVVLDGIDGTASLIVPVAMDKGLRFAAREEGGRHTPFHNKYRPQFRKILDYGEAGDNVSVLARSKCRCAKCTGGYVGHITLLK
jgi:YD repeat-containing protein